MDSTRAGVTPRIALATDAGHCLVRCTAAQRQAMERLLYRRYPDREWGTFFRFGFRRTRWGLLICWVDLLPPGDSDLDRRSAIVEFRPAYVRRALRAVEGCELSVGVIHSHPEDCAPLASRLDDDMDGYFAGELERYSSGRPYVSLIIARDGGGRRFFAGRAFDRGRWLPVNEWLTCGVEELRRERGYQPHVATKVASEDVTKERLAQLLGGGVVRRLRGSTIGVIGCSGLGTPAVHVLARAGIGRFVLVDKGRFKASNHERNHASRVTDLHNEPIRKVDLLRRLVSEISPATIVMSIIGDVLDERVLDELTHCDLILGCTDSIYARAALGDIAAHYSVPVLDLAVQMSATDGRLREQVGEIARYAPGLPVMSSRAAVCRICSRPCAPSLEAGASWAPRRSIWR